MAERKKCKEQNRRMYYMNASQNLNVAPPLALSLHWESYRLRINNYLWINLTKLSEGNQSPCFIWMKINIHFILQAAFLWSTNTLRNITFLSLYNIYTLSLNRWHYCLCFIRYFSMSSKLFPLVSGIQKIMYRAPLKQHAPKMYRQPWKPTRAATYGNALTMIAACSHE